MYLGDLKMNFDNLLEEERINQFIHDLVNEMGVELLGDIWDYGQTPVVDRVEEVRSVLSYLKQSLNIFFLLSLQFINNHISDLLKLISGGGGEGESSPIFEGVEPDCKLESRNKD